MKNVKSFMRKGLGLGMLLICSLFLLTGCSNKEPIDKATFAKTMDELSYRVEDQSKMISNQDFSVVYLARPQSELEKEKEDSSYKSQYQVEFYQFKDEESCEKSFDKLDDELVQAYKDAKSYKSGDGGSGNDAYRWIKTDKIFYQISKVDDTIVVGVAPVEQESDLKAVFDKLGY